MIKEETPSANIVEKNLGLVHSCANRFRGRGIEYDDLFQAGCTGLVKASRSFDESRGFAFSTYAVPVILGEIKRLFRDGGSVKVGRSLKERAIKAMREKESLANSLGREPTISELSDALHLDISETAELITITLPPISLTSDEENGGGQNDISVPAHDEEISDKIALNQVLALLPEKDKALIKLRYYDGLTQSKAAEALGMTQVQVSRREKVILLRMREELIK